ncbi:MAG: DNA mismatch repair protein MutS [Spirochaetaceae bacterium]|nr:MAG: DNA mismatch repair protein MutS [Spirochaetaceae bacterium]
MPDLTPMMQQYTRIKAEHQDAILFFRLGDFYEMFKGDAREASRLLGLTLTARNGVPMCGIPYHASHSYIGRLLKAGRKIAICEQVRLPEGNKGIADREVVEIVTPGTVVEQDYLDAAVNNYLLALGLTRDFVSEAYIDLSTGELEVAVAPADDAQEFVRRELSRLAPREILLQESLLESLPAVSAVIEEHEQLVINRLPDWSFDGAQARRRLSGLFGVSTLEGFGVSDDGPELHCVNVLLEYIEDTAGGLLPHVRDLRVYRDDQVVVLDESTQKNLELLQSISEGGKRFSLLSVLDHTGSAMGARLLRRWILSPLRSPEAIEQRLERVAELYHNQMLLNRLRDEIDALLDLERLGARVALERAHGKDLVAIRGSLEHALRIEELLTHWFGGEGGIAGGPEQRRSLLDVVSLLSASIIENPSVVLTEGNLIRTGYDEELDQLRALRDSSRSVLSEYLERERHASGIATLKLRHNRVLGYFFELSKAQASRAPEHFIRRQSLAGGERFTTGKLGEIESQLNDASERIIERERELFLQVRSTVSRALAAVSAVSEQLARIDCLQSFAWAATRNGYVRPAVDEGPGLRVRGGRHPVVERYGPPGGFVPNDLTLDNRRFALITGPNMAGKSTYLRQNALIALMAQIGSFVPAEEARIGVVDRIFCRVGASDNIARGQSTFLVEMSETSNILRNAGERSLVIMDEVGRGTGTRDGLAIAWAVCEHLLHTVKARTLFATHYHELTGIEDPALMNLSMAVAEERDTIVFLKRVCDGPSSNSYGIHVAELAGLPRAVLSRARQLAGHNDARAEGYLQTAPPPAGAEGGRRNTAGDTQAELFQSGELILREIAGLDPDHTTPLEALGSLARWRALLNECRSERG